MAVLGAASATAMEVEVEEGWRWPQRLRPPPPTRRRSARAPRRRRSGGAGRMPARRPCWGACLRSRRSSRLRGQRRGPGRCRPAIASASPSLPPSLGPGGAGEAEVTAVVRRRGPGGGWLAGVCPGNSSSRSSSNSLVPAGPSLAEGTTCGAGAGIVVVMAAVILVVVVVVVVVVEMVRGGRWIENETVSIVTLQTSFRASKVRCCRRCPPPL